MSSTTAKYEGERKRKKKRIMRKLRVDEVSMVDTPAQGLARVAIMKRADEAGTVEFQKKLAVTSANAGHSHMIVMVEAGREGLAELRAGQTSFADGHVHDWIMDDAGNVIVADHDGHTHQLAALVTKNEDGSTTTTLVEGAEVDQKDVAEGVLAVLSDATEAESGDAGETPSPAGDAGDSTEDTNVTTKNDKAVEDKAAELQKAQARAERAEAIVKMDADTRSYFDTLNGDEAQDEFLGKSADEQAQLVKAHKDGDEVVYKALNGDVFTKNDDERVVKAVKQADEDRRELAKEKALRKRGELIKRAGELLKNCPGSEDAKATLLGAVEGIADDDLRKQCMDILTAKDAGLGHAFETVGTSDDGNGDGASPEAQLQKMANEIRKNQPDLTPQQAYNEALKTPEGEALALQV